MRHLKQMRQTKWFKAQEGKIGYAVAWLLGVPLPVLFLIFLLRGCQ